MATAIFYDLENISKFTTPKNHDEFKSSVKMITDSELVDDIVLQRAYISTAHPAYIKYNKFLNSTGVDICGVDPTTNSNKANLVDFKMNVDCIAYSMSHNIDTVVIATGDADFGFLCEELKKYVIHVVVASYGITTNKSIILLSDDWVDFSNEYSLCDINELMASRIQLDEPVDYKNALCRVIEAMLNDKLIKRYMAMERFDIDMLREFTEHFYKAPSLENLSYEDFVSMLIGGLGVKLTDNNGRILILPSEDAFPEPPLNIYEVISDMDFDFSSERFRAWHSWFEENLDSVGELMYYLNFMLKNNILRLDGDNPEIVTQRKCAAALIEHTADAVSLLNIKPEDKELEKLRNRFYRNSPKRRPQPQEAAEEKVKEKPAEKKNEIYVQGTTTNYGRIVVYADDEAVFKVEFTESFVKYRSNAVTAQASAELREYFKGERTEFSVPIRPEGSEFQKLVWKAICDIPYGETRTYKEIAAAIGKPKSSRAVGVACNKNPLIFLVPCHRVIGASGDLTGYAAGVELKKALLKAEASPIDFKRFGKQYSYNAKHPESAGEYRTSEEIKKILEEEAAKAAEKLNTSEEAADDKDAAPIEEESVSSEESVTVEDTASVEENVTTAEEVKTTDEDAPVVEESTASESSAPTTEEKPAAEDNIATPEEIITTEVKAPDTEESVNSEEAENITLNVRESISEEKSSAENESKASMEPAKRRHRPYRRRPKNQTEDLPRKKYGAKKHTAPKNDENKTE